MITAHDIQAAQADVEETFELVHLFEADRLIVPGVRDQVERHEQVNQWTAMADYWFRQGEMTRKRYIAERAEKYRRKHE